MAEYCGQGEGCLTYQSFRERCKQLAWFPAALLLLWPSMLLPSKCSIYAKCSRIKRAEFYHHLHGYKNLLKAQGRGKLGPINAGRGAYARMKWTETQKCSYIATKWKQYLLIPLNGAPGALWVTATCFHDKNRLLLPLLPEPAAEPSHLEERKHNSLLDQQTK